MRRVLITGFGPFPGMRNNPSAGFTRAMARAPFGPSSIAVDAHVFAVTYAAVDHDLPRLLRKLRPNLIVMLGVASRAATIRVEARARNRSRLTCPDAERRPPRAAISTPQRPSHRTKSIAPGKLVAHLRHAGCDARVSRDAGAYLCNYLYWRALETDATRSGNMQAIFIHIPPRLSPCSTAGRRFLLALRMIVTANVRARRR